MPSAPAASTSERILQAASDLAFDRGFAATTVDAVLAATGLSKGAFFHHFPSKQALGDALLERYAQMDADVLESHMARAETTSDEPGQQLVEFIRTFETDIAAGLITQPGCLFASFVYERVPGLAGSDDAVGRAIVLWRDRVLEKLVRAQGRRPLTAPVDLPSLADHVWTVFEGGFLLARATGDLARLGDQLAHLREYLTLLLIPTEK